MSETTALDYGAMVTGLGGDSTRTVEARDRKGELNTLAHAARGAVAQNRSARGAEALKSYRVATDIIECSSRTHSVSRRIARLATLGARVREPQGTPPERTEYVQISRSAGLEESVTGVDRLHPRSLFRATG